MLTCSIFCQQSVAKNRGDRTPVELFVFLIGLSSLETRLLIRCLRDNSAYHDHGINRPESVISNS